MSLTKLIEQVEDWSKEKGLDKADSSKQFQKVGEEVGEVAAALSRKNMDMLKDGIGDVVVTLIILAQQNGMTLEECLQEAYDEIEGRTGKMVDGVFVKSEDLEISMKYFEVKAPYYALLKARNKEHAVEMYSRYVSSGINPPEEAIEEVSSEYAIIKFVGEESVINSKFTKELKTMLSDDVSGVLLIDHSLA